MFTNMIRTCVLIVMLVGIAGQLLSAQQIRDNETLSFAFQGQIPETSKTQQNVLLKKVIELNLSNASIEEALAVIAEDLDLKLMYSEKALPNEHRVSIQNQRMTLYEALWEVLEGTGLKFAISANRQLVIVKDREASEESTVQMVQKTITGTVTDANTGEVVPGATIIVGGTSIGTTTDMDGFFSLTVPDDTQTLTISFVGYQPQEVNIVGQTEISVELEQDLLMMDEMVVIGYGEQRRANVTGAISTVSTEDITISTASGIQDALQGRIAGVNITPQSGFPGGSIDMNIRGVSSFGNNSPLFVIDGVPVFNEPVEGGGRWGGRNFNPLATLNPNDIESLQVLKDASASAIYGARAANGVVIITTKRGDEGRPQASFRTTVGTAFVPESDFTPMMNSEQFAQYSREAYENAGLPIPISWQEPYLSDNLSRNTNWQREAYEPGLQQDYSVNVSGGSETARYAFSAGFQEQTGTLPQTGFDRYSVQVNTDFDISDKFRIGESVSLSKSEWTGQYNPGQDFINELRQSSPTMPVYNEDNIGGFDGPQAIYSPVNRDNKIAQFTLHERTRINNRLLGNAYAEYNLLDDLQIRLNVAGDIGFNERRDFVPIFEAGNRSNTIASLSEDRSQRDVFLIENTVTYQTQFAEAHDLTLLAGYSQQETYTRGISASINDFPSNDTRVLDAGVGRLGVGGDNSGWNLRSFLGRVNYSYNDTYNFMASLRRDGSSRFGENNRNGVFPSVSGSWVMSNESFMDEIDLFSSLIVRASWGQVGSQDISNYAARSSMSSGSFYIIGESQDLAPGVIYSGSMGNSDMKWEVTTQTNVGVDVGLLDEKLSLTMDYYVKDTDDILLQVPIASSGGFGRNDGPFVNAASVKNTGVEFSATYQDNAGELGYSITGNIATNKNEVVSLGQGESILTTVGIGWAVENMTTITRPGDPMGSFYGWEMEGIFRDQADVDTHASQPGAQPGDVKWRDLNNDGVIDVDDRTIIGNPFPDFDYGLNLNLNYRNFDMSVFVQGKQGHDIYNLAWDALNTGQGDNNATTEMLDRWTPQNRDTNIPRVINGNPAGNDRSSDRFVEDASYFKIQNIQIGYELPSSLLSRAGILRLRLYATAKNLFTATDYKGYNPEVGQITTGGRASLARGINIGTYPVPRVYEFGIQLNL